MERKGFFWSGVVVLVALFQADSRSFGAELGIPARPVPGGQNAPRDLCATLGGEIAESRGVGRAGAGGAMRRRKRRFDVFFLSRRSSSSLSFSLSLFSLSLSPREKNAKRHFDSGGLRNHWAGAEESRNKTEGKTRVCGVEKKGDAIPRRKTLALSSSLKLCAGEKQTSTSSFSSTLLVSSLSVSRSLPQRCPRSHPR